MSIKGTIGQNVASDGEMQVDKTIIDRQNPATANGKVFTITVQNGSVNATNTTAIKIIRINGINYDVIYNQVLSNLPTGTNVITLTTPQNVLIGDMLGFWSGGSGTAATLARLYTPGLYSMITGDVTTTTPISSFSAATDAKMDMYANIMSVQAGGGFSISNPMIF